ncbi:hypothetical protein E5288_WYG008356 [Bos mutus]|uniref:Uncharacterized protein n=1 Tax=Bos mutus TaxID=72004 RepID=A0A6B0RL87_9CETA|nr:hypothetical protein [Bos mutus]
MAAASPALTSRQGNVPGEREICPASGSMDIWDVGVSAFLQLLTGNRGVFLTACKCLSTAFVGVTGTPLIQWQQSPAFCSGAGKMMNVQFLVSESLSSQPALDASYRCMETKEEGKGKFRSIHVSTSVSVQSLFVEDKT